jgi:hypothetical protein
MAVVWFGVWLLADLIGGRASLRLDPPNWWVATLLLAIALDLNRPQMTRRTK